MAEEGFWADTVNIDVVAINGQFISVYKKYIMKIVATDINSVTKFSNVPFIVTDIKRYKVILDYL